MIENHLSSFDDRFDVGASPIGFSQLPLKEGVAAEIRRRIFSGELPPRSKIDQDQLAVDLRVSRHPVREAIIMLEVESLVEIVARRGAFVAALTRDDIRDHYHVFGVVSGIAAERAARQLSDEGIQHLEDINDAMERSDDVRERERLNYEFHRAMNRAGASLRLASVLRMLGRSAPASYETQPHWADRAIADHREILQLIRDRKAKKVGVAMERHLQRAGQFAVERLEALNLWPDE